MKTFKCREMDFECDFQVEDTDENVILQRALEHGKTAHGLKDDEITDDFRNEIRSKIREKAQAA